MGAGELNLEFGDHSLTIGSSQQMSGSVVEGFLHGKPAATACLAGHRLHQASTRPLDAGPGLTGLSEPRPLGCLLST